MALAVASVAAVGLSDCASASTSAGPVAAGAAGAAPTALALSVTKRLPHDTSCYTEGLQWASSVPGGGFYESCGLTGASTIRITTLNGKVVRQRALPATAFGEGTVRLGNLLYQLTWQERVVYVRNPTTLAVVGTRALPPEIAEGWGLSSRGSELVVTDGSSSVFFVDPVAWKVTRTLTVRNGDQPVRQLNELEFFGDRIWANVWMTEQIVVVDPVTGQVTATVSLAGLRPPETRSDAEAVANGIAFDPKTGRIFVTGKRWPVTYQVRTKPA